VVDALFAGIECHKRRYLEERLSSCNVREALGMGRGEFERGEVLKVWVYKLRAYIIAPEH